MGIGDALTMTVRDVICGVLGAIAAVLVWLAWEEWTYQMGGRR